MLACRTCRVALSAAHGCVVCDSMRKQLVAVGDTDEERPSLAQVSAEVIAGIRSQVRHYRALLDADKTDSTSLNRLLALSNSAAKVLEAARKLQADGKDAVDSMSFAERATLFIEWYMDLPPPYRVKLRAQMDEHETALMAPVAVPALPRPNE